MKVVDINDEVNDLKDFEIELLTAKNGCKIAKVNGFYIHSKYDPIQEAKRIIEKEYDPSYLIVLFGYGLGYLAEELIEKSGEQNFLIIDPIYKYLHNENNPQKFKTINQYSTIELNYYIASSIKNLSKKIKVICAPNYDRLLPEEYVELLKVIKDIQHVNQVNVNTTNRYAEAWERNFISNIFHIMNDPSLLLLKEKYNCPVVLASGGPSLSKQLPIIKEFRDKIIVVSAGSTVNSLLHAGIEPDYIISVDGGHENYVHFSKMSVQNSELIYAISSHYRIQDEFQNAKYGFLNDTEVEFQQHIKELYSVNVPLVMGGASVANYAYTIATYITTGPVALIGQDLAYTNNQTHAEHNKYSKKTDDQFLQKRGAFEVEGYYGDKVLTDYAFYSMKQSFEEINRTLEHNGEVWNCTEGGVKIKGINQMPFRSFCEKYALNIPNVKKTKVSSNTKSKIECLITTLENEINLYEQVKRDILVALNLVLESKNKHYFSDSTTRKLNNIDENIKNIMTKVSINKILEPIIIDVMNNYQPNANETTEQTFKRVYNQNKEMYSRLLDAVEKTKRYTREVIEKVKASGQNG